MEIVAYNGEEYEVNFDRQSHMSELNVGDLIYIKKIQGSSIELIAEVKEARAERRGGREVALITALKQIDDGWLNLPHDYHIYIDNDRYYKMESQHNQMSASVTNIIALRRKEFWVTKDSQILYPSQMDDEQLAKICFSIRNNTNQIRREIYRIERDILRSRGYNIPSREAVLVDDESWAINNIVIYKLILDEIHYRRLDLSDYVEKPKTMTMKFKMSQEYTPSWGHRYSYTS